MNSEAELDELWEKFLQGNLDIKKSERKHDDLLYGARRIPKLLGYAAGFKIVEDYYRHNHYSTKLSFTLPAKKYLLTDHNNTKKGRKK
jgi:uncharacterized protein YjaZ